MCAVLLFVREVRHLGRYQYTFGLLTIVLLLLPLVPGLTAGVINGAQLWIDVAGCASSRASSPSSRWWSSSPATSSATARCCRSPPSGSARCCCRPPPPRPGASSPPGWRW
jgi:hypothetical protein